MAAPKRKMATTLTERTAALVCSLVHIRASSKHITQASGRARRNRSAIHRGLCAPNLRSADVYLWRELDVPDAQAR